jgi:hypothetical protein
MVQALPSQCSVRVERNAAALSVRPYPTAQAFVAETATTPDSALSPDAMFGLATVVHTPDTRCSVKVWTKEVALVV